MMSTLEFTKKSIQRWVALLCLFISWGKYWIFQIAFKYKFSLLVGVVLILGLASFCISPIIQAHLETTYATEQMIGALRGLFLNIGSALIGAAAIVASFVLFAMQVNIERMPYGLFQQLSSDIKLLSTFALAFILAIVVATLSMFSEKANLAYVVISAVYAIITILTAFVFAYRRALVLVNPLQQLDLLLRDTRKDLRNWAQRAQRAQRATPFIEIKESKSTSASPKESTHDSARSAYFHINSRWTEKARRSVRHAVSHARRYAEYGDYEVSSIALNVVVGINAAYIEAKGKTFYASAPFFDNPLANDIVINDTLECLRKNAQSGITRRDEQQIEQTFQAMAALVSLYLVIDYLDLYATKFHALLASKYLADAVQDAISQEAADVLMEGVRLMGQSALHMLDKGEPNDIVLLSEKIALVSCAGSKNENYYPVTMVGVTQLASITMGLLLSKNHDIRFACEKVRNDVALIAKLFLDIPSTPLSNILNSSLGPYYSSTSLQSLRARLTGLVNDIMELQSDNENAKAIIGNIEKWADGLYITEKNIYLAAINAKSSFVFDMIYWITGVTEILLAVSNAPACDDHMKHELREHALWLISVLNWVPDDKESVAHVENYKMTEKLFEAVLYARQRDCADLSREIEKNLLSWTFKAGKYREKRNVLEQGLFGLAAICLMNGDEAISWIKATISAHLTTKSAISQEVRNYAAVKILERAKNLQNQSHSFSVIDIVIDTVDYNKMVHLLEEIASLLSPEIAVEKCVG